MTKMTAAHLEAVRTGVAALLDDAETELVIASWTAKGTPHNSKHEARSKIAREDAARLSEVAAHLAAQIEGADDAG